MNRTDLTYHKPAEIIDYKSLAQNFMVLNQYLISRNLDYGLLTEVNQ